MGAWGTCPQLSTIAIQFHMDVEMHFVVIVLPFLFCRGNAHDQKHVKLDMHLNVMICCSLLLFFFLTNVSLSRRVGGGAWVHQAMAFAIASEFWCKLPFARNFHSEDDNFFAISFTRPVAFASKFLCKVQFATFCVRGGSNSLANYRGKSEFVFAFAYRCDRGALSRCRCRPEIRNQREGTH